MSTNYILHIDELEDFEYFLESKGYMILALSNNPYEVLRAKKDKDLVIIYKKKGSKEYLSTTDKDYHLVREFVKNKKNKTNADYIRDMDDNELAYFLVSFYKTFIDYNSCLDWLKQQWEDK